MKLGQPEISLDVSDLEKSLAFYKCLGFEEVEGNVSEGWLVVAQPGIRIGLYKDIAESNSITFFGGDVESIAAELEKEGFSMRTGPAREDDGSTGAKVLDPDGNLLYFNA